MYNVIQKIHVYIIMIHHIFLIIHNFERLYFFSGLPWWLS